MRIVISNIIIIHIFAFTSSLFRSFSLFRHKNNRFNFCGTHVNNEISQKTFRKSCNNQCFTFQSNLMGLFVVCCYLTNILGIHTHKHTLVMRTILIFVHKNHIFEIEFDQQGSNINRWISHL